MHASVYAEILLLGVTVALHVRCRCIKTLKLQLTDAEMLVMVYRKLVARSEARHDVMNASPGYLLSEIRSLLNVCPGLRHIFNRKQHSGLCRSHHIAMCTLFLVLLIFCHSVLVCLLSLCYQCLQESALVQDSLTVSNHFNITSIIAPSVTDLLLSEICYTSSTFRDFCNKQCLS